MTEPVAMELLEGATDEMMLGRLEKLTTGLPSLEVDQALDFRAAAAIYRGCRQARPHRRQPVGLPHRCRGHQARRRSAPQGRRLRVDRVGQPAGGGVPALIVRRY
jgi:hypothetical protein